MKKNILPHKSVTFTNLPRTDEFTISINSVCASKLYVNNVAGQFSASIIRHRLIFYEISAVLTSATGKLNNYQLLIPENLVLYRLNSICFTGLTQTDGIEIQLVSRLITNLIESLEEFLPQKLNNLTFLCSFCTI